MVDIKSSLPYTVINKFQYKGGFFMSVKETVLKVLEENKGLVVSGQRIATEAGASRAAVWKAISRLREEGHIIEASTNKGYTLSSKSDLLSSDGIHAYCKDLPKENIFCYKTIDSTNTKAKQIATQGGTKLALVVSEEQTNGRGRMRRNFFSPVSSGIYMSLLIKPTFDISKSILVTTATSVAVCRGISSVLGIDCKIKWVNDIFFDGRKIGGILTEGITDFETGHVEYIVIGIGINYSTPAQEFPDEIKEIAGSLLNRNPQNDGESIPLASRSRNELIGTIITELLVLLSYINESNFLEEYRSRSLILGQQVIFSRHFAGNIISETGKAVDIDQEGGLIVLLQDGTTRVINSGEVSIRKTDSNYR